MNVCLGYLLDSQKRKHGIYPVAVPNMCPQQHYMAYSLRQILADPTVTARRLTQQDKLRIAFHLSSSTLQLYKTPWLDEMWGKEDVCFVQVPGARSISIYEHPYINRQLSSTANTVRPQAQQPKFKIIRNQTLYNLGILLIELWYGKTMQKPYRPHYMENCGL